MSYKVNPINFRLGYNRIFQTSNICLTNYTYQWLECFNMETILFNFFYKEKLWIISSKIINFSINEIYIFCNFFRLRPYFNKVPKRKRKSEKDLDVLVWKIRIKKIKRKLFKKKNKLFLKINSLKNKFILNNFFIKKSLKINKKQYFVFKNIHDIYYLNQYQKDKLFLFYIQKYLKLYILKKKVILKIRNIDFLKNHTNDYWDDALREIYLTELKRKHFVRTIFRDFLYIQRISYLEMNAQLFCVLIVKLFEITKFHRRLIFLLKAVINTAEKYYKHIICKIKLKGKMQYRKRTKTLYLSNKQLPLSTLDSVIEYGKAPAITPFGIVGIKLWLYYLNYKKSNF